MKREVEFPESFNTNEVLPHQVGRLQLGLGNGIVRILLMPDGIHIVVPEGSKFVHTAPDFGNPL